MTGICSRARIFMASGPVFSTRAKLLIQTPASRSRRMAPARISWQLSAPRLALSLSLRTCRNRLLKSASFYGRSTRCLSSARPPCSACLRTSISRRLCQVRSSCPPRDIPPRTSSCRYSFKRAHVILQNCCFLLGIFGRRHSDGPHPPPVSSRQNPLFSHLRTSCGGNSLQTC
jgi:hypothetical protein